MKHPAIKNICENIFRLFWIWIIVSEHLVRAMVEESKESSEMLISSNHKLWLFFIKCSFNIDAVLLNIEKTFTILLIKVLYFGAIVLVFSGLDVAVKTFIYTRKTPFVNNLC